MVWAPAAEEYAVEERGLDIDSHKLSLSLFLSIPLFILLDLSLIPLCVAFLSLPLFLHTLCLCLMISPFYFNFFIGVYGIRPTTTS